MAHYLVRAKPIRERLEALHWWLQSGEIGEMRPFGGTLQRSLENARLDREGYAVWEQKDYCHPPLAMERQAVLDRHFVGMCVTPVAEGQGWRQIEHLPSLWASERRTS